MSLKMRLYGLLPLPIKNEEYLVLKTRATARDLFAEDKVDEIMQRAVNYSNGHRDDKRDKTWTWLIDTYWMARRQIRLLDKSLNLVGYADRLKIDDKHAQELIACFKKSMGNEVSKTTLEGEINRARRQWKVIQERIREVPPPMSFSHVFLGIKDRSGIEATSLIIGSLVVLGAVYMSFSYETVAGISAYKYWTIEDLILRGILVAPLVALIWGAIEIVFMVVRRFISRKYKYLIYGWIVKVPVIPAISFLGAIAILVSVVAYSRGAATLDKFARMNEHSAQMATVTDGTVLSNVYLAGTSNRTAVFLKAKDLPPEAGQDQFNAWQGKMELYLARRNRPYSDVAFHVIRHFQDKSRPDLPSPSVTKPYEMVVMDRAPIICHAQMEGCEESSNRGIPLSLFRQL